MSETRNIVFLGASYAGISATHYFLKHVYPHLPSSPTVKYKVILINASPKFYQRHASPRAIASASLLAHHKLFIDIEPGFAQYGDKVQFLVAKATSWDPEKRILHLTNAEGKDIAISYHALVLATGSKTASLTQSSFGNSHEEIEAALTAINEQVASAKSIVIAGGGPAGVETAGEIAEHLNGSPGWFQTRPSNPTAKITLLTSAPRLLPALRPSLGAQAARDLERLGVEVQYNTKVTSAASPGSQTTLTLSDDQTLTADLYLPATGTTPLTSYAPPALLSASGHLLTNPHTLRLSEGKLVYALGDVTSFSRGSIPEINAQVPVLASNLQRDLLAAHGDLGAEPEGEDRRYQAETRELQLVPVGRRRGVGALWGWWVPSWFVWLVKGRDFMVGAGREKVFGKAEEREVKWTGN